MQQCGRLKPWRAWGSASLRRSTAAHEALRGRGAGRPWWPQSAGRSSSSHTGSRRLRQICFAARRDQDGGPLSPSVTLPTATCEPRAADRRPGCLSHWTLVRQTPGGAGHGARIAELTQPALAHHAGRRKTETVFRTLRTLWPSGLRRWLKAPFRKGVGSNPTGVIFHCLPPAPFDAARRAPRRAGRPTHTHSHALSEWHPAPSPSTG